MNRSTRQPSPTQSTEVPARVEVERKLAESRNTATKLANERDSWQLAAERNLNNLRDAEAELAQARNQEHQRLKEALEKLAADFERRADDGERMGREDITGGDAFLEAASAVRKEAALLDTLHPSGEQGEESGAARAATASTPCVPLLRRWEADGE